MKIKILFVLCLVIIVSCAFAKEVGVFGSEGKDFNGLKLADVTPHRVSDRSAEVYFTKDGIGLGITKGGEFTLNANNKRLNFIGLSGIMVYDKDKPEKLYSFDILTINKAGFKAQCEELGVSLEINIFPKDNHIDLKGTIKTNQDKHLIIGFCMPVDGSTSLIKDKIIWIDDFYNAVECTDKEEYSNLAPNDNTVSRYPLGTMMTSNISFALAAPPQSIDSKFVFYRELKTFVNQYDISMKKDIPQNIEFIFYKYDYSWGFRGAFDKYSKIYKEYFPDKSQITKRENIKELDNFNYSFKELLSYDGYRIKEPIEYEDLYFLKCVSFNKPVYYEIPKDSFASEYVKAVFFGFIPIADNVSMSEQKIINEYKNIFGIIQKSDWNVISQSESNNRNVISELYSFGDTKYAVVFNNTDLKRISFFIMYEYNGENTIKNIIDNSTYNIKNKTVDMVLNPYSLAMFEYEITN